MCLLTLAVLVASPIFAQAQATDTPPAAQDLRQTALGFRNAQDFDKAIETYKALLAQNPTDALSLKVDLGLCYKAKKDYTNAMPLFTEVAASQDGRKAWAMFYIEDCCCEQGKIADAVAELTKAYNECPEARADILLRRAALLCDIQKYKEGLADYQEFLANYPGKQDLIATFSARLPEIKLRATGLFDGPASGLEAEWARAKADGSDPVYVNLVACRLGLAYKAGKNYAAAIPLFEEVGSKGEGAIVQEALFFKDDCLSEQRKHGEAVSYLTELLAKHPEWREEILFRRASRQFDARQYEAAIADFKDFAAEYPSGNRAVWAKYHIAQITLNGLHDRKQARALLTAFIAENPDFDQMIVPKRELASCSYQEGDYATAAKLFLAAYKYPDPSNYRASCLYMAANCYQRMGDTQNAQAKTDELITLYPADPWAVLADKDRKVSDE